MNYDFETWENRTSQGSAKWLAMHDLKKETAPDTVPLSVADMEFQLAPPIRDGIEAHLGTAVLGYTMPTPYYFECITGWLKRRHGLEIRSEWIDTTPGVVAGLGLAVRSFTQEGDGIIIFTPVYYPFYQIIELTGRKKLEVELLNTDGAYSIDFARLEEAAADSSAKAILLCSPHNPVGRVWKKEELEEIGKIAAAHNLLVFADEIHGDLIMPGQHFTPWFTACPALMERSAMFTAPSKTFNLAGMQGASAVLPNGKMRAQFAEEKRRAGIFTLNALAFTTTELAYTRCDGWYGEMLKVIDANRQLAKDCIEAGIPGAVVTPLEGTYLLWVDLRCLGLDAAGLEKRMTDFDLFFDEGYIFGSGGAGFERINLAAPRSVIAAAMERLVQAARSSGTSG